MNILKEKQFKIKKHNYKNRNLPIKLMFSKNEQLKSPLHSYSYSSLQQVFKYNSGITLITLIISIIVLLILAGVTINFVLGKNGILNKAKYASGKYTNAQSEENTGLEDVENIINDIINGNSSDFAGGTWDDEKGVNAPKLSEGLIPVTINDDGTVTELTTKEQLKNWYNYKNKEWANAITKDKNGNITGYFVWIPRYEYKITYYTDMYKTNTTNDVTLYGDINVKFIPTSQTTKDAEYDHIHPAFENGSSTGKNNNFMNGEWKEEIPGFWVAKFPAGFQQNTIIDNSGALSTDLSNSSDTLVFSDENYSYINSNWSTIAIGDISTDTKMTLPVFKPLTYVYNCICIGDTFTLAKQITKSKESKNFYGLSSSIDSHILKNSEWGAVIYLTYSQHGRNGTEPNKNNYYTSLSFRSAVTGIYVNGSNSSATTLLGKPWYEQTIGMLGSSTGNRTGVFDLNGCVNEFVAGYISNGNAVLKLCKGNSDLIITSTNKKGYETLSNEYITVYPYSDSGSSLENFSYSNWLEYRNLKTTTYGYGDGILENSAYLNNTVKSWNTTIASAPRTSSPTFGRGSNFNNSGIFSFYGQITPTQNNGFRIVLIP